MHHGTNWLKNKLATSSFFKSSSAKKSPEVLQRFMNYLLPLLLEIVLYVVQTVKTIFLERDFFKIKSAPQMMIQTSKVTKRLRPFYAARILILVDAFFIEILLYAKPTGTITASFSSRL